MVSRMHDDEVAIDEALVRRLLEEQFPELADRSIASVEPWGTDNAIWRLGDDLVLRLPRIDWASEQADHEARWLPILAPHLPVIVPEPIAVGQPGGGYPYRWAINRWVPGHGATLALMKDPVAFAEDLAAAIRGLWRAPTDSAPPARNRALALRQYADSAQAAIQSASAFIDEAAATRVWQEALAAAPYDGPLVWVHGDLDGNCLVVLR
jgi:aminoglycoside phosphotransferase (APT) family kinase protein